MYSTSTSLYPNPFASFWYCEALSFSYVNVIFSLLAGVYKFNLILQFTNMLVPLLILLELYFVWFPSNIISKTKFPFSFFEIVLLAILNTSSEFAIAIFETFTSSMYLGNVIWNLGFWYTSFPSFTLFSFTSNSISLLSAIVLNVFLEIANSAFVFGCSISTLFVTVETLFSTSPAYMMLPV